MKFTKTTLKTAKKSDNQKPRFSLIPQLAMVEVIKGFEHGAIKYGQYNYSNGIENTRLLDAAWRHMNAYLSGEDIDESGVEHLALIACNCLMALDNKLTGNEIDNRNAVYKKIKKQLENVNKNKRSSTR